jgi:hypothetical protein
VKPAVFVVVLGLLGGCTKDAPAVSASSPRSADSRTDYEYMEAFDSYFPKAGIEYYHYDQLGSSYSDQPNEPLHWEIPRFVDAGRF